MKTNKEYQEEVESRYGRPLKDIMQELIIERHMDQWEGSTELGVPKETFITWRTRFRLGPDQRRADHAKQMRNKTLDEYKDELANVDLERSFIFRDEKSLSGFKEVIERMIELEKRERLLNEIDSLGDISQMLRITTLESIISYLDQYENSDLHKIFDYKLEYLMSILNRR